MMMMMMMNDEWITLQYRYRAVTLLPLATYYLIMSHVKPDKVK